VRFKLKKSQNNLKLSLSYSRIFFQLKT